ncbi:MAG: hypothetical protein JW910_13420 [Anaerolineae bacterium]|nr:hypothetical protein [Anaerolineae bacterium]
MAVDVRWADDARTIILIRVQNPWTWLDLLNAAHDAHGMIDAAGHPVAVIYDYSDTATVPGDPILQLPKLAQARHPQETITVAVDVDTSLGQAAVSVYSNVYHRVHFASTLADAYALIAQLRAGGE